MNRQVEVGIRGRLSEHVSPNDFLCHDAGTAGIVMDHRAGRDRVGECNDVSAKAARATAGRVLVVACVSFVIVDTVFWLGSS